MICKNCNKEIPNDSEYCSFCGKIVERVVAEANTLSNVDKGYAYLELKEWKKAKELFDFAIVNNDNKARAYIGRLLAKVKLPDLESLSAINKKLTNFDDFKMAVKYADDNYKLQLEKCNLLAEEKNNQKKAKSKKNIKTISKICLIFILCISLVLGGFVGYKNAISPMVQYSQANKLLDDGKYEDAIKKYENLKSYKDSEEKITEVLYQQANSFLESGNYSDAFYNFEKIIDYKDSNDLYTEARYNYAVKLYNESNFVGCAKFFSQVKDYKDSNTYLQKQEVFWRTKGNIVTLGSYEQDNNSSNGKEKIEWIILNPEHSEDSVMLISKYCLDYKLYDDNNHCVGLEENEGYVYSKDTGIDWLNCTLRSWLNNSFYNIAFNATDKNKMKPINIIYSMAEGNWLTDKVSILSAEEAEKLFDDTVQMSAGETRYAYQRLTDTHYNGKRGAFDKYSENYVIDYWLRKLDRSVMQDTVIAASHIGNASILEDRGEIYKNSATYMSPVNAVRPIIVVSVN